MVREVEPKIIWWTSEILLWIPNQLLHIHLSICSWIDSVLLSSAGLLSRLGGTADFDGLIVSKKRDLWGSWVRVRLKRIQRSYIPLLRVRGPRWRSVPTAWRKENDGFKNCSIDRGSIEVYRYPMEETEHKRLRSLIFQVLVYSWNRLAVLELNRKWTLNYKCN